jgi:hypothetical protein
MIYDPERRINPYEVYPSEWHPYLPAIMVMQSTRRTHSDTLTLS